MSDLFDKINDDIQSTSDKVSKGSKSQDNAAVANKANKATDTSKAESKSANANKHATTNRTESSKGKSQASTSQPVSDNKALDRLAKIISTGFSELKDLFKERDTDGDFYDYDECIEDEFYDVSEKLPESDAEANAAVEIDMFDSIAGEMSHGDNVGPDVRQSLSGLVDKMLQVKISDKVVKEKRETYLRPNNISFLNTPKVNKPIWDNLSSPTRVKESQLQNIQKDFLTSAIPTIKVMEKIFDSRDDMASLDPKELLDILKDSFLFLGCANLAMIKQRRDNIKRDLPLAMQGLCKEDVGFSSTLLFGDNLNSSIKEVSELNKISHSLKTRGFKPYRGYRRGSVFRGRGRVLVRRGFRGRNANYRYAPYYPKKSDERKSSNSVGPSTK